MSSLGLRPTVAAPLLCLLALACGGQKEEPGNATGGGPTGTQGGSSALGQGGSATAAPLAGRTGQTGQGGAATSASGGAASSMGGAAETSTGGRLVFSSAGRGGSFVVLPPDKGTAGAAAVCSELSVEPMPVVPTVLVLVDNSSSMFERDMSKANSVAPWDLLYSTLMDPAGAIKALEGEVRFGFTSYKGSTVAQMSEAELACAELTSVEYALDNFSTIDTTYKALGSEWMPGIKWETPTGHALSRAAADLAAFQATPPGPKNILLVTDGNPNTCQILDPQCGQDLSIKAAQDAYAAGIKTFVIGIGEVIQGNVGCEEQWGRCGPDHLQDLANAGLGLPVAPPPESFVYQSCAAAHGNMLLSAYDTTGMPGAAPYYTAADATELTQAIEDLLKAVLTCTFDMDVRVTGNPALGSVLVGVGAEPVIYGDENGWKLEDNRYQVTLQGTSCEKFKAEQTLDISFPCDPLTGLPIAVKR